MESYDQKLIEFPMSNLNKLGIFCLNKTSLKRILFTTTLAGITLFCIVISIIQYFYIKNNIFDVVDNTEAAMGYGQIFLKLCYAAYNKEKFINLIRISKQFWNTDSCSDALKKEIGVIVRTIRVFQKIFYLAIMSCTPLFTLMTFFGKKMIMGSWNMENQEELFRVVWFSSLLTFFFITFFISNFDCVFLGLCYEIIIQFKILRNSLENLSVRKINSEEDFHVFYQHLRKNIQYHKFLLEFIKEMQYVYSVPFMIEYLTISPLICSEIYATTESTVAPLTIRYGFAGCILIMQLAFYCIASSLVFSEVMTISYGIYNSDWYSKYFRQIQTPMVMMIQASQKELQFSACGLVPININTLASVVKVAFSASAVFKSLK